MINLDHIGIAVLDLPKIRKLFTILGLKIDRSETVAEQRVHVHFVQIHSENTSLELLEPMNSVSPVAQFINKKGPGIHHLSFGVASGELMALCDRLRDEGYRLVYAQPRSGAHKTKINFIHPESAGGMLIEITEPEV